MEGMLVRNASRSNPQDLIPLWWDRDRIYFNRKIKYLKMSVKFWAWNTGGDSDYIYWDEKYLSENSATMEDIDALFD